MLPVRHEQHVQLKLKLPGDLLVQQLVRLNTRARRRHPLHTFRNAPHMHIDCELRTLETKHKDAGHCLRADAFEAQQLAFH